MENKTVVEFDEEDRIPPMPVQRALTAMNATYKQERNKYFEEDTPRWGPFGLQLEPQYKSLLRIYPDETELYCTLFFPNLYESDGEWFLALYRKTEHEEDSIFGPSVKVLKKYKDPAGLMWAIVSPSIATVRYGGDELDLNLEVRKELL